MPCPSARRCNWSGSAAARTQRARGRRCGGIAARGRARAQPRRLSQAPAAPGSAPHHHADASRRGHQRVVRPAPCGSCRPPRSSPRWRWCRPAGDHAAEFAAAQQLRRVVAEARGQHTVEGRGRAATLHMAQQRGAHLAVPAAAAAAAAAARPRRPGAAGRGCRRWSGRTVSRRLRHARLRRCRSACSPRAPRASRQRPPRPPASTGSSGSRMTSAPPAMPPSSAIQPA
jgi:hypothetical protein